MTAENVRSALRARYSDHRRYAVAEEVGLSTGYSHRRLDMMVLDCYYSNGFRIDGFEIKVSTSDLRRELEDPEKHIAFFDVIDYYTLVAPKNVVEPFLKIIPPKWGILIVNDDGSTRYNRKPLALEDRTSDRSVPRAFLASITRAIQGREPSAQELLGEYERGLKYGKEEADRHRAYLSDRVAKEADKIEAYDKLCARFLLWGENIDEIMDEFEAFRKLDISWLRQSISTTIKNLEGLNDKLKGGKLT